MTDTEPLIIDTGVLNVEIIDMLCDNKPLDNKFKQASSALTNIVIERNSQKTPDEQRIEYFRLLYFDPTNPKLHFTIALSYLKQGLLEEGRSFLRLCLHFDPLNVGALLELGIVLRSFQNDEAIKLLERARNISPDTVSVLNTLGVLYVEVNRFEDALSTFLSVLDKTSKDPTPVNLDVRFKVLGNLGTLLSSMGRNSEALSYIIESEKTAICINHLQTKFLIINYLYPTEASEILKNMSASEIVEDNVYDIIYKNHLLVNSPIEDSHKNIYDFSKRQHNDKIRVGYVSSDFRNHVVSKFLYYIFEKCNKEKFELYCYSNYKAEDQLTEFFKKHSNFKQIHVLNAIDASKLIYEDNIDILIDLNGNTSGSRFDIFATKPAPVQVTYLGYPNTSGLSQMDYRITDGIADNINSNQKYVEKLLRIDDIANVSFVNYFHGHVSDDSYNITCKYPDDVIILGAINRPPKNSVQFLSCIREILKRIPNAKLLIKFNSINEQDAMKALYMKELEVDSSRLVVRSYVQSQHEYNQLFNQIDILLDTFPYSGTTTTCDALFMGTPVITMLGPVHSHNVSASIISRMKFNDEHEVNKFIANDSNDYITKTVNLANDRVKLRSYKKELRDIFLKSQDHDVFVSAYEKLLENIVV